MIKKVFFSLLLPFTITLSFSQSQVKVDSLLENLSLDEKIGQLFMVPVYAKTNHDHIEEIEDAVKSHHVGGVIVMDGTLSSVSHLTQYIQELSTIPLFVGIDDIQGVGKVIDSAIVFPGKLALGAIQDDTLTYSMAAEVAHQLNALGINLNFGPSGGLAKIGDHEYDDDSFGSDPDRVTRKIASYAKGFLDNGIMVCAKRFPINGITIVEAKKGDLPKLNAYIDPATLKPYKLLFSLGVQGVLPASTDFPLFYEKRKSIKRNIYTPPLLSSIYAGSWLRKELDFKGLVFISIPDIKDQKGKYNGGEAELLSFQAGNDLILMPQDIGPAIRKIKRLLRKDHRYMDQLNQSVRKILTAKLNQGLFIKHESPVKDYNFASMDSHILNRRIVEESITLLKDENALLPIRSLDNRNFYSLCLGGDSPNSFTEQLDKFVSFEHVRGAALDEDDLEKMLTSDNVVVVGIFGPLSDKEERLLNKLQSEEYTHVLAVNFAGISLLPQLEKFNALLTCYDGTNESQKVAAQQIFGAIPIAGKLSVSLSTRLIAGTGTPTMSLQRLQYSVPEDAGVDSRSLARIDEIAQEAIEMKATPGCYVLVARNGKVVFEKSYGHLTYDEKSAVSDNTLYDLASVTKVAATLQSVMFLYDRGMIDLNKKASFYLPELRNSNKKDFTLIDILTHQAGLWPFLPFWSTTMEKDNYLPGYYSKSKSSSFPHQVAKDLYASSSMPDSLWSWIIKAKVRDKVKRTPYDYKYSDMGFYILKHLSDKLLNQPAEEFLQQNLYEPLGAHTTGYLPLDRFPTSQIAPTEDDKTFRKTLLVGTVHDQGAAMHGGVSGHAGLFSDANDLAKLGQMLLQQGYYGGIQYYKPQTVNYFVSRVYETSRRGVGWDKPVQSEWNSPTSISASPRTFGHTGFTGTCIWVDPEFDLVYIFLSNRVHPDMNNNKLLTMNIRSRIQETVYRAIFSYCGNPTVTDYGALIRMSRNSRDLSSTN